MRINRGWGVCFDDLMIKYDLEPIAGGSTYDIKVYDYDGKVVRNSRTSVQAEN